MANWIPIVSDVDRRKVQGWVGKAPPGTMVAFKKHDARSIEQNSLLWSRLSAISEQAEWYGEKLPPEAWKDLFTADLRQYKIVPGLNPNTVVPLGMRTSSMTKHEMTALLQSIEAFAAEHGVVFLDETYGVES